MSLDDYKLSCELLGHSLDVRALDVGNNFIVSGSRDKTTKIWQYNGSGYSEQLTLTNHKNFVSSVCVLDGGDWICTGSNDATICVYTSGNIEPFAVLKGHTATVSALAAGIEAGTLVSGSWDKTARIWKVTGFGETTSITLEGHEAAVWAVTALKSGKYVTGSADKSIIYWSRSGDKLKVLKGHKDCVRGLLSLPNDGLISAGNDALIKIWNEDGECVKELSGHTNYIYSIAFNKHLGDDVIVSGGEDSTLRMWNADGALGNPITLPAQSLWAVTCLSNGDIVTGSSDGIVRIFTRDPKRVADENVLAAFQQAVEIRVREASAQLGGVKVNELPGPEALLQKGREDQTKMVRHPDGKIICYQWANGKWNPLGDVVGAAGGTQETSGKTLFEGKEYDFVFSVDISDSAPPIKLPYNRGEDPWMAAQKFIHRHELPQVYLDQVANFIIKNSSNAPVLETASSSGYEDPFTGGNRYVPTSNSGFDSGAGNVDPFTGSSSYNTQSTPQVTFAPRSGQNTDPFTGANSHTSTSANGTAKHFPFSEYTLIDTCDARKVLDKLREFNQTLEAGKVSDDRLESAIKLALAEYESIDISVASLSELLQWPTEKLFPVLDIVRLAVRDQTVCSKLLNANVLSLIVSCISDSPANQLMSIRCLGNMLQHGYGRGLMETCVVNALAAINCIKKGSANLQIAIATFFLNLTVNQIGFADQTQCQQITETILDFLLWNSDAEALYRCYRALGNLLCTPYGQIISTMLVSADQVMDKLRDNMSAPQPAGFEKLNEIARDIVNAL